MEYQVKTAHGTLFCRREGSGPLLLLIHGVACDSEFFREASAILSKKFTVISMTGGDIAAAFRQRVKQIFRSGRMQMMRQRSLGQNRNGNMRKKYAWKSQSRR